MTVDIQEIRSEFIEKIGLQSQNDGLPRIAGRLLGLLIWDGHAVAFSELAEQLQVSRGSISTASRILEERRLIKRVTKPGQRQDFFQLSDNPYASMMEVIKSSVERSKAEIEGSLCKIPDEANETKQRVAAYANFFERLSRAVTEMAEELKS